MNTNTQAFIDNSPLTHAVVVDSGYAMELYHNKTHIKSFPHLQHYGVSDIDGTRIGSGEMAAAYACVVLKVKVFEITERTQGDSGMYDAVALTRKEHAA